MNDPVYNMPFENSGNTTSEGVEVPSIIFEKKLSTAGDIHIV